MPPSGTVTFLFTDIEGSTERWDAHSAAMGAALRRHDEILRAAIETNDGFVFKTIGDAFCAAFKTAPSAFAAALGAQRAIAASDWVEIGGLSVRMAVHTGTAEERDGDYFGPTVNRVARLLSIAHGGQIISSEIASELARGNVEIGALFLDLGRHRLKGMTQPESVRQVAVPDLQRAFPALRSQGFRPNNLPLEPTDFVGRDGEFAALAKMLREHRIVTLVGTGGIGKTRLAVHVASDLLAEKDDGVWLVELAAIVDPAIVAGAIAATLSVQESPQRPAMETLAAYLRGKKLLLILDNCEHVLDEVAKVAESIARSCADVTILATSREALGVAGEHLYHVPPLDVASSAKLFAARARAADASFAMTEDDEAIVIEICRRLDGIALAIELAAARVKVLSLGGLSKRLGERLRILSGGSRTAMPRQRTLTALIDWSYDLLSEDERTLFRRLAVFSGNFSLDAAIAVCADEVISDLDVLDLLASLVAKSLLQADSEGDEACYRLLESTSAYAREKLAERGEETRLQRKHALAYAQAVKALERAWESTPPAIWRARAARLLENVRAALHWSLEQRGDVALGQTLVASMRPVWSAFATAEGRRWVRDAIAAAGEGTDRREIGRLEIAEAQLALSGNYFERAFEAARRARSIFEELDDDRGIAEALLLEGGSLIHLGNAADGEERLNRALDSFRAQDAKFYAGTALQYLGSSRLIAGDVPGARTFFAEALHVLRATPGAARRAAHIAGLLGEAEFQAGEPETAVQLASGALETARASGDRYAAAYILCNIAAYFISLERLDEARSTAAEALDIACDTQEDWSVTMAVHHIAAIAARRDPQLAVRLFGFVDARIAQAAGRRDFTEKNEYDDALSRIRQSVREEEISGLLTEGGSWSEERAVAAALTVR